MAIADLKQRIARLPEQPGVYVYTNPAGDTIYVGKARVLRDRVRSYLGARGASPRTDALLDEIHSVEVIVTDSVVEALALENHLIKQRAPKYNVLLRDDKNYPYLQLTTNEAFPRVLVARRVERDGSFYAGPFLPAWFARRTMSLTHRLFGIRSCNEVIDGERGRPCLEFDIGRCVAPCVRELCSPEEYGRAVERTRMFLEARNDEVIADLKQQMLESAEAERFEQAAQLRDAVRMVEMLRDRQQKIAVPQLGDRDAFGVKSGPPGAVVEVFQMRVGKVIDRIELVTATEAVLGPESDPAPMTGTRAGPAATTGTEPGASATTGAETGGRASGVPGRSSDAEIVQAAIQQFYQEQPPPPEIHVPVGLDDAELLEAWLSSVAGRTVRLVVPRRGDKRGLLELATRNAAVAYDTHFNENTAAHYDALETLRAVLGLPSLPRRIECFDISTIQGAETVAAMVVCEDGRMKRSDYRKFRVRGLGRQAGGPERPAPAPAAPAGPGLSGPAENAGILSVVRSNIPDDFAAMHEVVLRRYRKLLELGGPFPDLVLIDGGKGQLSAAYQAFERLGLANLVAIGIAKKEELIFTREHPNPIALSPNSPALLLIQRIRDEAHRFAVTFHRHARTMRDLRSELDDIPGIGPRRRRTLLTRFGSVAGVRRATREELVTAVGRKAADAVIGYFTGRGV